MYGYIYRITNLVNNKIYIGSSKYNRESNRGHFTDLSKNRHKNIYLQRSYNKYGKDSFEWSILATCFINNRDELYEIEDEYRDRLNCYHPNGYNINKQIYGPPIPTEESTKKSVDTRKKSRLEYKELKDNMISNLSTIFNGDRYKEPPKHNHKPHLGKYKDISGRRNGKLTAIRFSRRDNGCTYWICRCDCGNEKEIDIGNFRPNSGTESCAKCI